MHNWIMLETAPAREIAASEDIDRLVGVDSSYCPTELRLYTISRQARLKKAVAVPILPRTIFITASFPDLDAVKAVRGIESIIRNDFGQPVIIPSWEMKAFMAEVEIYRLKAIHRQMKLSTKPEKSKKFRSLKEAAAYLRAKTGENVDPETGEILENAA
jgi:hypothetical protein